MFSSVSSISDQKQQQKIHKSNTIDLKNPIELNYDIDESSFLTKFSSSCKTPLKKCPIKQDHQLYSSMWNTLLSPVAQIDNIQQYELNQTDKIEKQLLKQSQINFENDTMTTIKPNQIIEQQLSGKFKFLPKYCQSRFFFAEWKI